MADQPTTTSRSDFEIWGIGGASAEIRRTPTCWRVTLRGSDGGLVAHYPCTDAQEGAEDDARECFEEFKRAVAAGEYEGRAIP